MFRKAHCCWHAELADAPNHLLSHNAQKPSQNQAELEMKPYRPSPFGQEAALISLCIPSRPSDLPISEYAPEIVDNETIIFANEEGADSDSEQRGLLSNKSFSWASRAFSQLGRMLFSKLPLTSTDGEEGSPSKIRGPQLGDSPKLHCLKQGSLGTVLTEESTPRESRATEEEPDIRDTAMHMRMQQWWANVDEAYMQPVFGGPKFKVSC